MLDKENAFLSDTRDYSQTEIFEVNKINVFSHYSPLILF